MPTVKMKRTLEQLLAMVPSFCIGLCVIVFCLVFGSVSASYAKDINLRLSSPYFVKASPSVYAAHMCELIEKKTNGKVKIKQYYGGALGSDREHIPMIQSGSIDMAVVAMSPHTQKYPLNNAQPSVLPFGRQGAVDVVNGFRMNPEVKAIMEEEQAKTNTKIFYYNAAGVNGIVARAGMAGMKDLVGKKVNTHGPTARATWAEMGWNPVNVTPPDVYESLSRGVIDGGYGSIAAVLNMKWYELGKTFFCLDIWTAEIPIVMNMNKFNKLPSDVRQAIVEASEETAQWSVGFDASITDMAFKAFEKGGCQVVTADADERDDFAAMANKNQLDWWMGACQKGGVGDQAKRLREIWDTMYAQTLNKR